MDRSPLFDTFARAPIAFERGEGAWLTTTDGRRMLDFSSGVAVNVLGHAHPALVGALKAQAEKVWHVSNLYRIPEQEKFAETLCRATFADKVFFGNSGAEAVECALKTARRWHFVNGHPERVRIITFAGAFHGRTLATLAATGNAEISRGLRAAGLRLRPARGRRPQGGRGDDRAGDRGDPDRADPGRGRHPPRAGSFPPRAPRAVRPPRPAPHLRRGADRHRPHRQALRLRVVGRHAGHHDRGQGPRRRLPGRRLPRHRRGGEGHDRRHPWLDLRRQSARHGGRPGGARRAPRRRLPRRGQAEGPLPQAAARVGGRFPSRPRRRGPRRGAARRRPLQGAGRRGQCGHARPRTCSASAPARTSSACCRR